MTVTLTPKPPEMKKVLPVDEQTHRNLAIKHLVGYLNQTQGVDVHTFTDANGLPDPAAAYRFAEALREQLSFCINALHIGVKQVHVNQVRIRFIKDQDCDPENAEDAILRKDQVEIVG